MNRLVSGFGLLMLAYGSANAASLIGLADPPASSYPYGWQTARISDDGGVVIGYHERAGNYEPFRWQDGIVTHIDRPPSGPYLIQPYGVTADGNVIVGSGSSGGNPDIRGGVRWQNGVVTVLSPPLGYVTNVSADGSTVIGGASGNKVRWQNGVITVIPNLPNTNRGAANATSADGSVVVGTDDLSSGLGYRAFRWQNGVTTGLASLIPAYPGDSSAVDVSADGSTVVGWHQGGSVTTAVFWKDGAITNLGCGPDGGYYCGANAVSGDGSVIVGYGRCGAPGCDYGANGAPGYIYQAFYWSETGGMQRLIDVLAAQGATGLDGWTALGYPTDITADGLVIIGSGIKDGKSKNFLARLDPPTVTAEIDIQPFDTANEVKPASDNPIIVAVHSTSVAAGDATDFDATQVDPSSLKFGSGEAPNLAVTPWVQDLDGDADSDVMFAFRTQDTGIFCGDTEATLTGSTYAAATFTGTDNVMTTDCVDAGCHP